jgi:Fe-S-cluster containining protein
MREEPQMQGYLLMRDGTEHKVGDSLPQIECFRCGICCVRYRPKVTLKEMKRIARKLGMSIEAFMSAYVRAVPTKEAYILQSSADTCPFLRWDEKGVKAACAIHDLRPKACRNWVPSLSRPECREGLAKLRADGELLLPEDMYKSGKDIEKLSATLSDSEGI